MMSSACGPLPVPAGRPANKVCLVIMLLEMTSGIAFPLTGQVAVGGSLEFASRHVWRGITWSDEPTFKPGLSLAVGPRTVQAVTGVWASYELLQGRAGWASLLGSGQRGLTELDYWAEVESHGVGVDAHVGVVHYDFRSDSLRAIGPTTEIYAHGQLPRAPLSPRMDLWYDVRRVKGVFLEAGGVLPLGLLPNPVDLNLDLGVTAGFSAGQNLNPASPTEVGYTAHDGLAYIDVNAMIGRELGPLGVIGALHVQLNRDRLNRILPTPLAGTRSSTVWFSVAASWSVGIGP